MQQFFSTVAMYFWIGLQSRDSKKHMKIIKEHLKSTQTMQNYNMLEALHTKVRQKDTFRRAEFKTKRW